MAIDFAITS